VEEEEMNERNPHVLVTFIILLFLTVVNCSFIGGLSKTGSSLVKPQSGEWKASLLFKTPGSSDQHWVFSFSVSDDGKQITQARLFRYSGDLTPDTRISISEIISMPVDITNNSILLSFTDMDGWIQPRSATPKRKTSAGVW
jgi:hypothetical protein